MNQRLTGARDRVFPVFFLIVSFFYVVLVVHPAFWFHKQQTPFLVTSDFFHSYLKYPGGFSDWLSDFFMQSFYYRLKGSLVFFALAAVVSGLTWVLLQQFYKSTVNKILAMLPLLLTVTLASNYNFSLVVVVSVILVQLFLLPLLKIKAPFFALAYFSVAAILVYYVSGSGFLWAFSATSIFFMLKQKGTLKWLFPVYIIAFSFLVVWLAFSFIFPISVKQEYFHFYTDRYYYLSYQKTSVFYLYVFSLPVLLGILSGIKLTGKKDEGSVEMPIWFSYAIVALVIVGGVAGHLKSYNSDKKKITASDYYCYYNEPGRTAKASMSLKEYSFAANMNYNLSICKAGKLTEDFFKFFQISGTDALYPDYLFQSEMSFISTDFYYELGYISEARHWAYESLVNYPYSIRALQMLVKIHLITHEYKAAEKYLDVLQKGIIGQDFVKKYRPYFQDTTLINSDQEIMQKRSFIPAYKELPPAPIQRFLDLLKANPKNKTAFECMMLYYLLDGDLDNFIKHYSEVKNYFSEPVAVYEEAILMYGATKNISVKDDYNISEASINRFKKFADELRQKGENDRKAMNEMYPEFGDSYLFYFQFIFPRIVKHDYVEDDAQPPI